MNYIITPDSITVNYERQTICVQKASDPTRFESVKKFLRNEDEDGLISMLFPARSLPAYVKGMFTLTPTGKLFLTEDMEKTGALPVPTNLAMRLLDFMSEELPFAPFANFWRNLQKNPSDNSRTQLYAFLEKHKVPITPDGCFILYKKVHRSSDGINLWDKWTFNENTQRGTVRYNPGDIAEQARDTCVEDPDNSCGPGLHSASVGYVESWYRNGVLIEVKINPMDVVSVPHLEIDGGKMRVCRMEVLGEVEGMFNGTMYVETPEPVYGTSDDADDDDDDYDCDYDCDCDCDFDCDCDDSYDCEDPKADADNDFDYVDLETENSETSDKIDIDVWDTGNVSLAEPNPSHKLDVTGATLSVATNAVNVPAGKYSEGYLTQLSGQQLIDLVKRRLGHQITFSHKSKKSVLREAIYRLDNAGLMF